MRPVKFSPKTLIEVFYQHKVLNKEKMLKLSGCSNMTAWRILSKHGYMTSYNFNAAYYTLADIPQFDKDGLWSYRNIRFSRYGSLTNTVTALVCSSTSGLDANKLLGILAVNVTPTLTNLYRKGKLKREKVGGVFVYLHTQDKERQTQLTMRQSKRERALERMALPEPERIIAVLVELIKRVELEPQQIARRLSTKGIKITPAQIQAIFAHYQLPQKKPLELLMLRAQLIDQVHGSLPDYSLLPKHYVLDVVNDHTLCDHCHCGLRIQRTLVRYPVGILLGEPILCHHIKKCPVCGREYQYEQLNDPHSNGFCGKITD